MKIGIAYDGKAGSPKIFNEETGEEVENVIGVGLECANAIEHILTVKFVLKIKTIPTNSARIGG